MLDHMAQRTCPHCGASIEPGRTVCPNCRVILKKKNPLTPYLAVAGLVVIAVVVVAFVMTSPVSGPGTAVEQAIAIPADRCRRIHPVTADLHSCDHRRKSSPVIHTA